MEHRSVKRCVTKYCTKITKELLDAAGPSLQVVSTMSVGFEHVDLSALAERNIRLGYTPDVLTDAVADITVMLALMAGRNIREHMQLVDNNNVREFVNFLESTNIRNR
jgi:glyoxylate/hydroxypyruvate reductase